MADASSYKNIFKTTFLFGFVKVFNIIVKIGLNKVVALILGPEGVGVIGMFNTTIQTVVNFAGLGVSQSGVRDISEANSCSDTIERDTIITMVNKVIIFTGLLGMAIMIVGAPLLSRYTFGTTAYTASYALLSIAVCAQIISAGQTAVLTGMRKLRQLAYCSMISAVVGLVTGVPFYWFFREKGIVPSLIVSSLTMLLVSWLYVRKISYTKIVLTVNEIWQKSTLMVKMGISLMIQGLMLHICNLIVASYVANHGGLDILGYYQAGITIITGYFGIILTAMTTEYYPRLSSIHNDNAALKDAVNAQSEMGMMMAFPLVMLFVYFSNFFFRFLYSSEFEAGAVYVNWAVMGTITIIASNSIGMVLLVKQAAKIYLTSSLILNIIIVSVNILLYHKFGLLGLGLGYFFSGLIQFIVYGIMMKKYYSISFSRRVIFIWVVIISAIILLNIVSLCDIVWIRHVISLSIISFSLILSLIYLKQTMNLNMKAILLNTKNRLLKHK